MTHEHHTHAQGSSGGAECPSEFKDAPADAPQPSYGRYLPPQNGGAAARETLRRQATDRLVGRLRPQI